MMPAAGTSATTARLKQARQLSLPTCHTRNISFNRERTAVPGARVRYFPSRNSDAHTWQTTSMLASNDAYNGSVHLQTTCPRESREKINGTVHQRVPAEANRLRAIRYELGRTKLCLLPYHQL